MSSKRLSYLLLFVSCFSQVSASPEKLAAIEALIQKNGINDMMEQFIKYEQEELPIQRDMLEIIVGVIYIKSTKAKIYQHMLRPNWDQIISNISNIPERDVRENMPNQIKIQAKNSICSNEVNQIFLNHGVKIVNRYSNHDGKELFSVTIRKSDCDT